jgi:hypothetical protein
MLLAGAIVVLGAPSASPADALHWIGTWATAAEPAQAARAQTFPNQTVRLIVHISAGGKKLRIRLSNTYGDEPLMIGAAHMARRTTTPAHPIVPNSVADATAEWLPLRSRTRSRRLRSSPPYSEGRIQRV